MDEFTLFDKFMKKIKCFNPISLFLVFRDRFYRIIHHEKDSTHSLALGAAIGSVVAFTPTFGFQLLLVTIIWSIARIFWKKPFSIAMGYVLTWTTNYITVVPYYFIAYFTGVVIMKSFFPLSHILTYEEFRLLWAPVIQGSLMDSVRAFISVMIKIGTPLFIGSVPYAIIFGFLTYPLVYKAVEKSRKLVESLAHRDMGLVESVDTVNDKISRFDQD